MGVSEYILNLSYDLPRQPMHLYWSSWLLFQCSLSLVPKLLVLNEECRKIFSSKMHIDNRERRYCFTNDYLTFNFEIFWNECKFIRKLMFL